MSNSLRKLVLTHSKVFYNLLGIRYVQCHVLLHTPSQDKNHLFPCLWSVFFHLFYCCLTSLLFSYAWKIAFLSFFLLPIPLSIPLFQLNRAVRFTKKQRWNSLGVIIPYISNWNCRGQEKMLSVNIWCFLSWSHSILTSGLDHEIT